MQRSIKPLRSYEQSVLLSAMFFDSKNIAALLQFFPDDQAQRMEQAKQKFVALTRNDRMTQIVVELRRLLLIDEHRVDWIHKSWIEDALLKEPAYLRALIREAIEARVEKRHSAADKFSRLIPFSLIFRMFIEQLTKRPQKTAIYDKALIRLQSFKGDGQKENFHTIGYAGIHSLGDLVAKERFLRFLEKKGLVLSSFDRSAKVLGLAFNNPQFRQFFLQELIRFKPNSHLDLKVFSGLVIVALYLSRYKHQWQKAIVLSLEKYLGQVIENIIVRTKGITITEHHHSLLADLIMSALDRSW